MESNKQTELTSKIERPRESRLTALGGGVTGGGIEQNGKRNHGHGQQCGDCSRKGNIRGTNGNGKKYNKF